jgi:hypothetical protein
MPSSLVHASVDLMVFGFPYLDLHRQKNAHYKTLGWKHRNENHEYYQLFGSEWSLDEPYPSHWLEFLGRVREQHGPIVQKYGKPLWCTITSTAFGIP